jgi:hypothetical protein
MNIPYLTIEISHRTHPFDLLEKLLPDTKALFGLMTPQHMVEHLAFAVRFSNGKIPQQLYFPKEKAEKVKMFSIDNDNVLPMGFKNPILPSDTLLPLEHPNLQSAIESLNAELTDFDFYFKSNPDSKPVNPVMGELTQQEWTIFHNKHFTHHFKQFGLL